VRHPLHPLELRHKDSGEMGGALRNAQGKRRSAFTGEPVKAVVRWRLGVRVSAKGGDVHFLRAMGAEARFDALHRVMAGID
jgi:hypothetical protein